jgi:DNA sulfur modification protein DndB
MNITNSGTLSVPALRAHMGDWIYYAAFMKMSDISARVSLADDIHEHKGLRDMIQRSVDKSKHAESIKEYLLSQEQRLFNSLVLGVIGGAPDFYELKIGETNRIQPQHLPSYLEGALGVLEFTGGEKMFAIDGQHRVVGIRRAVADHPELGDEEVITLLVGHKNTPAGLERSRRLFSTLNRYAKPVSKSDIIALDEDDIVAILTRRLVEQNAFFSKFLLVKKGKGIQVTDKRFFTTIEALYDTVDILLRKENRKGEWARFKKFRPKDATLDREYKEVDSFWGEMTDSFVALSELAASAPDDEVTARYRSRAGGNLLFRPVGLLFIVGAIRRLVDAGYKREQVVTAMGELDLNLDARPWERLIWDPVNRRMVVSGDNRDVAERILVYGLTGREELIGRSERSLRKEWAGLIGQKSSRSVVVPDWTELARPRSRRS